MGLVRLLDLSHSLWIVWRGSGEMACLTGVGLVSHLFFPFQYSVVVLWEQGH